MSGLFGTDRVRSSVNDLGGVIYDDEFLSGSDSRIQSNPIENPAREILCRIVARIPIGIHLFDGNSPRSNTHEGKRPVPMKFPSFHGSSIRMNGSSDWIYSVSAGIDRNLPQPTTVYGHRFIASGSYNFPTGFLADTACFLVVFTENAWEYCCQETLTWAHKIRSDSYRVRIGPVVG